MGSDPGVKLYPVRWKIGCYTSVRYVEAESAERAEVAVATWVRDTMPDLWKVHKEVYVELEHQS